MLNEKASSQGCILLIPIMTELKKMENRFTVARDYGKGERNVDVAIKKYEGFF